MEDLPFFVTFGRIDVAASVEFEGSWRAMKSRGEGSYHDREAFAN